MSEPKRPGRPALDADDPCVDVHLRMPSKEYDVTFERAQRDRVTVPERIRRDVREANKKT